MLINSNQIADFGGVVKFGPLKVRDDKIDSVKFGLIVLVITGHVF